MKVRIAASCVLTLLCVFPFMARSQGAAVGRQRQTPRRQPGECVAPANARFRATHQAAPVHVERVESDMYVARSDQQGIKFSIRTRGCRVKAVNEPATLEMCVPDPLRWSGPPYVFGPNDTWAVLHMRGAKCKVLTTYEKLPYARPLSSATSPRMLRTRA